MNKKILFIGLLTMLLAFGFIFTTCDTGHGTSPASLYAEDSSYSLSAENTSASYKDLRLSSLTGGVRQISIKFNVKNGGAGLGLTKSYGVVGTEDNSRLVKDSDNFSNDFTITTLVPDGSGYVNIWWQGKFLTLQSIFVQAKMQLTSNTKYEIVLDYNASESATGSMDWVTTKNLYDVVYGRTQELQDSFQNAYNNAVQDKDSTLTSVSSNPKEISIKFNVKNGGSGITKSYGIVRSTYESVKDSDNFANDFTIHISVSSSDECVYIWWKGNILVESPVYLRGSMKLDGTSKYEIVIDYNGENINGPNIATNNLYDVSYGRSWSLSNDFDNEWGRARQDKD